MTPHPRHQHSPELLVQLQPPQLTRCARPALSLPEHISAPPPMGRIPQILSSIIASQLGLSVCENVGVVEVDFILEGGQPPHPLSPGTIALNRYRKKSLLPEEGLVAPLCGPARSGKPPQLLRGLSS